MNISRSLTICFLVMLFFATSALAVDPGKHISQYAHSAWRIQDGVFSGAPTAITQTKDGYVWIGTPSGLLRFDGIRFVQWTPLNGKQLMLSGSIFSLLGASDGSLWIGTGSNLAHLKDGDLVNYPDAAGRVNSIVEDSNGTIWFARSRVSDTNGPLCQVIETSVRCYGKADGIASPYAGPLVNDSQGNFWIGSSSELTRWSKNSSSTYIPKGMGPANGLSGVQALAAAPDGSLWVGINRTGPGLGLQRVEQGILSSFVTPELDGRKLEVSAMVVDRENALWIGTESHGIYRIYNGQIDRFLGADGLSSDAVIYFYEDLEGNMWVATSEGIDCFRNTRVVSFSTREGLGANSVGSVLASKDGTVWIGNHGYLESLQHGNVSSIQANKGLPGVRVTSMLEDHAGRLWVGVDNDLSFYEKGRFNPVKRRDGSSMGVIVSMTEDRDNNIWALTIGNPRRLIRIRDFTVQEELTAPQIPTTLSVAADPGSGVWLGLESGDLARYRNGHLETFPFKLGQDPRVRQVIAMPDGSVFGGTTAGLIAWKNGKQQTLTVRNGLPCDGVFGLVSDAEGDLWLSMKCGLVKIPNTELQKWWENADTVVTTKLFDAFDGARPSYTSFEPRASRSPDGRLWFSNDYVVQMIDPANLAANKRPPPVRIEEITADRKSFTPGQDLRFPPRTRDLEIDYTALTFVAPKKVQFRYKLEERDADWQDAGTRRQAFYSDLRPGKYRFRVIACNNDGIWNDVGATLNFSIAPAWYQTTWFLILCVASGFLAVWCIYQFRVRQIAMAMSARFDERLAERTRLARELHDTFLQTVQGSKMVADDALEQSDDPVRMQRAMQRLSEWLETATQEGRAALNSLRSSTTKRNDLAEAFQRATAPPLIPDSISVDFSVVGTARNMHPIVRDEVYRIGYEAIRNACAHSGATQLEVELKYAQDLAVRVRDNGKGIEPAVAANGKEGHFGLKGMRERADRIGAKLTLISSAVSGTEITLVVPGNIVFRQTGAVSSDH